MSDTVSDPEFTEPTVDPRVDRVAGAVAQWTRHLVDLGGRNTLLWYRDLPTGTLDLTTAHPGGISMLHAGRPTKLSDLVREPGALDEARRRARAIAAKSRELKEERGILTGFLALGMASWTVRQPGGQPIARRPAAPVLLRACTLRATGLAQSDYTIDLGGDLELNPVLVHYLESEQGITLDADQLEGLAATAHGIDPTPVYAALVQACAAVPDFHVEPRLVLGNFSYAKLPMVADLARQGTALADHDIIAALAGDPGALTSVRSEIADDRTELEQGERDHLVLDADSSQHGAIEAVRAGSHLVIHGPPGTGKSQTIANLLAALAADGKRVLFVAEKRAAIDAVLGRLDRVGLGSLVLDLHDGAQSRHRIARDVVGRLDALLDRPLDGPGRGDALTAREASGALLRDHLDAMHHPRTPWGVSALEVQEALTSLVTSPTPPRSHVRLRGAALRGIDRAELDQVARTLTSVASLGAWRAGDEPDPWFGARVVTTEEALDARDRVERLAQGGLAGTQQTLRDVFGGIRIPPSASMTEWEKALAVVGAVRDTLETFRAEVFDIPLDDLVAVTASPARRRELGSTLGWFERWRLRRVARRLLRPGPPPVDLHGALVAASGQRTAWRDLVGSGGRPEIPAALDQATAAHRALLEDLQWLDARLRPPADAEPLASTRADDLSGRIAGLAGRLDRLAVLPSVIGGLDELSARGLAPLVEDLAERDVAPEQVRAELELVWWSSIADELAMTDPRVGAHDGEGLRRATTEFMAADREVLGGNVTRTLEAVRDQVETMRHDRPYAEAKLRAEAAKSRRLLPPRDLMPVVGGLLTAVTPCWVMSPLVVASVLPAGVWFDVVVFDEASQIPPAEAISAISRARQVVVAGDSRQLPPTSFFTAVTESELPPEQAGALTEGVESILDVLAAALPARRLSWHYRSLDERLIAFSNTHIYDGTLVTFPGTAVDPVVRFEHVEAEGVVTEGDVGIETTRAEVDRIVALVLEHARRHPEQSLGVIALGLTHAQRIEEGLRRALLDVDAETAAFFADDRPEPFFVKNLERVQGDERDAIIVAIGFGKTPHGRVLYRFGPLNLAGGERRLNVAVTRARRRMTCVASITAEDLDPARLKARGAVLLREFLAYAANGASAPLPAATSDSASSPLMSDLARRLREAGVVVHENLGHGEDPVDLAVESVAEPRRLTLAVESDGRSYAGLRTTRDRDRLRAEQLERLGWTHLRVYSTDLFRDPERDVARILTAVGADLDPDDQPT